MDNKALANAKSELSDFLQEHPHLAPLQDEIEQLKKSCDNDPLLSTIMIFEVIKECLKDDLIPSLQDLASKLDELRKDNDQGNKAA
jgi:hypothetical protein